MVYDHEDSMCGLIAIEIEFPCVQSGLLIKCGTNYKQNNLIILYT